MCTVLIVKESQMDSFPYLCKMQQSFENFKFNKQILNAIAEAGYQQPTEIQEKAITPILAGQDVMGANRHGRGEFVASA